MNFHVGKRLFVAAAVFGAVAVFAMGFFVALGVRSVVAGPDSAPAAAPPNPGHTYDQIELPVGTWPGLDADTVDGAEAAALEESAEIDADIAAHASDPSAHHTKTTDASEIVSGAMAPERVEGTAWTALNDGPGSGLDADTLDGLNVNQIHGDLVCQTWQSCGADVVTGTAVAYASVPSGFHMTGGGCWAWSTGGGWARYVIGSYPDDNDTWVCSTGDLGLPASSGRACAWATGCKVQ